jgi:hypothetical protein
VAGRAWSLHGHLPQVLKLLVDRFLVGALEKKRVDSRRTAGFAPNNHT